MSFRGGNVFEVGTVKEYLGLDTWAGLISMGIRIWVINLFDVRLKNSYNFWSFFDLSSCILSSDLIIKRLMWDFPLILTILSVFSNVTLQNYIFSNFLSSESVLLVENSGGFGFVEALVVSVATKNGSMRITVTV